MQDEYIKLRELTQELEKCQKEKKKIEEELDKRIDRLIQLEEEREELRRKTAILIEQVHALEGMSKSKDELIQSLNSQLSAYRNLLIVFVLLTVVFLALILWLSQR